MTRCPNPVHHPRVVAFSCGGPFEKIGVVGLLFLEGPKGNLIHPGGSARANHLTTEFKFSGGVTADVQHWSDSPAVNNVLFLFDVINEVFFGIESSDGILGVKIATVVDIDDNLTVLRLRSLGRIRNRWFQTRIDFNRLGIRHDKEEEEQEEDHVDHGRHVHFCLFAIVGVCCA